MRYLLQIYSGGAMAEYERLSADEQDAIVGEFRAISQSPAVIGGDQLQPADTATKEHLGGYFLVEADELDEALEIAARIPTARMGGVIEVRPLVER